jgi:hypothetical protein
MVARAPATQNQRGVAWKRRDVVEAIAAAKKNEDHCWAILAGQRTIRQSNSADLEGGVSVCEIADLTL